MFYNNLEIIGSKLFRIISATPDGNIPNAAMNAINPTAEIFSYHAASVRFM